MATAELVWKRIALASADVLRMHPPIAWVEKRARKLRRDTQLKEKLTQESRWGLGAAPVQPLRLYRGIQKPSVDYEMVDEGESVPAQLKGVEEGRFGRLEKHSALGEGLATDG